jgi:hypothetical protein
MLAQLHLNNPKFTEWLKGRLESATTIACTAKGKVDVRWAQGRTKELNEIVKLLEGSADILRKADDRASGRKSV